MPKLTPADVGTIHVDIAARQHKPGGPSASPFGVNLNLSRAPRMPPSREPVDTAWINGRPPGGWETMWEFCRFPPVTGKWERDAIREARARERAREWRP